MAKTLGYLITWTTYGTWLPGDPRGFQTREAREYVPPPARYAREGETPYTPERYRGRYLHARTLSGPAARLSPHECRAVLSAIFAEIERLEIVPRALAVGPTHVHLLARFGALEIRPTVARLKSAATRSLVRFGRGRPLWCRGCHMKSLFGEAGLQRATGYVLDHAKEGAVVHAW